MDWQRGLPKESGHYWAFCENDGDMLEVLVEVDETYGIINVRNVSRHLIAAVGMMEPYYPWLSPADFDSLFTHFHPYTRIRPCKPSHHDAPYC